MGLFNFLKKGNEPSKSPKVTLPNSFEELFDLEVSNLLNHSKFARHHLNGDGEYIYDEYEVALTPLAMGVFNLLIIATDKDKKILPSGALSFLLKERPMKMSNIQNVVNTTTYIMDNNEVWAQVDELHIKKGEWRGRFITGKDKTGEDKFAGIEFVDGCLRLDIIGYKF